MRDGRRASNRPTRCPASSWSEAARPRRPAPPRPGPPPPTGPPQPGVKPGSDPGQTVVRPGSNPGQTGVRPGADPGQPGTGAGFDPGLTPPPGEDDGEAAGDVADPGPGIRRRSSSTAQQVGTVAVPPNPPAWVALVDYGPTLTWVGLALLLSGAVTASLVIFRPTHQRLRSLEEAARALGEGRTDVRASEAGRRRGDARSRASSTGWPTICSSVPRRSRPPTRPAGNCWRTSRTN